MAAVIDVPAHHPAIPACFSDYMCETGVVSPADTDE